MKFEIDEKTQKKIDKWMKRMRKDKAPEGAIGGRFEYRFTPMSIGTAITIFDHVTKKEINVTDYDLW